VNCGFPEFCPWFLAPYVASLGPGSGQLPGVDTQ
jgi:hypothetical protein